MQTEDRMEVELQKAAQFQARMVKRQQKPQRIRAVTEESDNPKPSKLKLTRKKQSMTDMHFLFFFLIFFFCSQLCLEQHNIFKIS